MKDGKFWRAVIYILLATVVLLNTYDISRLKKETNALYKLIEWQDEVIEKMSEQLYLTDDK